MAVKSELPIWLNLFRHAGDWQAQAAEMFARTPLFEDIPLRTLRRLVNEMYHRNFADGELVFEVGDPGLGMYLVLKGGVSVHLDKEPLAQLGPGDFFGEVALFGNETRTASASAHGETELVGFFRPALEEWVDRSPELGARFLLKLGHVLAERLRRTNERLVQAENG
jgi:CRP-like cAMP-binding protein